jgi:carbamoyltransferase
MRDLLITLGHNASAIAVENGNVLNAYEAERITGVKSDSRFAMDAIQAIMYRDGITRFDRVYVTHWDPSNNVDGMKEKYWQRSAFAAGIPIISQESLALSHHDAHAYAAVAFAGDDFPKRDAGVLVVDGFGSMGEHISYYKLMDGVPHLVRRFFGYENSLGLMYQYATHFLGMKMHEDEYKLLGYGAKIVDLDVDLKTVDDVSLKWLKTWLKGVRNRPNTSIELDALPTVQVMWSERFRKMLDEVGMIGLDPTSFDARVVIGYIVQRILEDGLMSLLTTDVMEPTNLIITGGVAYNVALNRRLLKRVRGKLCAMPLAGDQGNSIGIWCYHNKTRKFDFRDLCWGKRDLATNVPIPDGLHVFEKDSPEVEQLIRKTLAEMGFVNLVRGRMEFGPRALCNTTTLARADDMAIVDEINRINGRNTVMPFAPVIWHEYADKIFPEIGKTHRSGEFMICAMDYDSKVADRFAGAALKTSHGELTGRPQVYRAKYEGDSVAAVLQTHGLLINTSFNVHGVPIVCDLDQIIHSHQFQRNLNPNVVTIVIKE